MRTGGWGRWRADLWRTCVRSLIHDIPATSTTPPGNAVQSCLQQAAGSAGRDREASLIFIVTPCSSAGSGCRRPGGRLRVLGPPRRELWPPPSSASLWLGRGRAWRQLASRGHSGRRRTRLMVSIGSRARRGRPMTPRDLDSWLSTLTCQPSPSPAAASPSTARRPSSVAAVSCHVIIGHRDAVAENTAA